MKTLFGIIAILISVNHCFAQIIDGYTDKLSYRAGESVTFFTKHSINGTNNSFDLKDLSGNPLVPGVTISGFIPNIQSGKPCSISQPWIDGWGYTPTCTTWSNFPQSGYYMLDGKIPIIIKGDNSNDPHTGADIVIVCPTNTINAYTDYSTAYGTSSTCSQYSLYDVSPNPVTTIVSSHRPQNRDRYGNCDDAFLDWIRTWAANHSPKYNLNFISDSDLDDLNTGWEEIRYAKLLIIPGHSEYWTRGARVNFDKFVDAGKNALILSGNTMWCQVRYQKDPINHSNPQMVCYRGANWCTPPNVSGQCYNLDGNSDELLRTYAWMSTDLKYSVLGSIGSDILRGGQSNFTYGGHKIINSNSPLLKVNGVPIFLPSIGGYPYIPNSFSNTEYDGTLVKCDVDGNAILVNGEPELDLAALGFYQGEIIGYEYGTPDASNHQFDDPNPNNHNHNYFPFMVFKKTYTSGTVVNVNSNRWCDDDAYGWTGSNPVRANITANMITLMINDYNNSKNGELLFTNVVPNSNNPGPGFIAVKPAYTTVNYSACLDGKIHFTPHGIYLDHVYKVDNGFISNPDHTYQSVSQQTRYIDNLNKFTSAIVDANCLNYRALRIAQTANNTNKENENIQNGDLDFSLFPNPATGKFNMQMLSSDNSEKNIYIFNSIDQEIYHQEKTLEQNIVVDLSVFTKGIYFVRVEMGNKFVTKKIAII